MVVRAAHPSDERRHMILVIMAAGMGSRYGGLKQLDPLGPGGEFLLDYSIYDAKAAGFDRVVFVIKEENLELFRETVGKRIENNIRVDYVFQDIRDVPEGLPVPADRVKPLGTAHAVYCCRNVVDEPFAVINSDDFYGRDAFMCLAKYLRAEGTGSGKPHRYCMAGYRLMNTLTENGTVSRGVCTADADGYLSTVVEHTKIGRNSEGTVVNTFEDGSVKPIPEDLVVSMNCWGFSTDIFGSLSKGFEQFAKKLADNPAKAEYYLPTAVQSEIDEGTATVKVLVTEAKWFGVTYKEDRPGVVSAINDLISQGVYPEKLWN